MSFQIQNKKHRLPVYKISSLRNKFINNNASASTIDQIRRRKIGT